MMKQRLEIRPGSVVLVTLILNKNKNDIAGEYLTAGYLFQAIFINRMNLEKIKFHLVFDSYFYVRPVQSHVPCIIYDSYCSIHIEFIRLKLLIIKRYCEYVSVNLSNQAICKILGNCQNACFNRSIYKLSENFNQFVN